MSVALRRRLPSTCICTAIFLRFSPFLRTIVSLPAGLAHMPLWKFFGYTFAGSLIWNTFFVLVGYVLGENWHIAEQYAGIFSRVVLVSVVLVAVWWVVRRLRRGSRGAPGPGAAG